MQQAPLLENIDWVFTSENWSSNYPNTMSIPLAKPISDHCPFVIKIGTSITKAQVFRFENLWLQHHDFQDVVQSIWQQPILASVSAKLITEKFKCLRKGLKIWSKNLSNLTSSIQATNNVFLMWDLFEEYRVLTDMEQNGRDMVKENLLKLLSFQRIYWRQRATIKWIKFSDENSKFFQAMATERYRKNNIANLQTPEGLMVEDHTGKEALLFQAYTERLRTSKNTQMQFDLRSLIRPTENLYHLTLPFTHEEIDNIIKEMPNDKAPGPDGFNADQQIKMREYCST